jgi:hypothetical protein
MPDVTQNQNPVTPADPAAAPADGAPPKGRGPDRRETVVDRRVGTDRRQASAETTGYGGPERRAGAERRAQTGLERRRGPGRRRSDDRKSRQLGYRKVMPRNIKLENVPEPKIFGEAERAEEAA